MTTLNENMNLNDLHIAATDETPEVLLTAQTGKSYLKGRSLPENAFEFYRPIISWAKLYVEQRGVALDITLCFDYLNSSSSRFLFEMLHALDQSPESASYIVRWQTDPDDELMIEKGEELQRLLKMKVEII
jgi:uncharacterized protein YlzI (FlbEa/FlbD family)